MRIWIRIELVDRLRKSVEAVRAFGSRELYRSGEVRSQVGERKG